MRLSWWYGGYESGCQCRGPRFHPWSRRIPHAMEQLSLGTTSTEPVSSKATSTEPSVGATETHVL